MTFAPKRLSDHVQAVLDALMAAEGHMTVAQLQKATGRPTAEVQGALKDLCLWGIAMSVGERWKGATKFIHHSKLRAQPRPSVGLTSEPWRGVDWSVSTMRPGCLDHERHGSLQPDGSVKPYRAPALLMTGLRLPNPATSGPVKQKP